MIALYFSMMSPAENGFIGVIDGDDEFARELARRLEDRFGVTSHRCSSAEAALLERCGTASGEMVMLLIDEPALQRVFGGEWRRGYEPMQGVDDGETESEFCR